MSATFPELSSGKGRFRERARSSSSVLEPEPLAPSCDTGDTVRRPADPATLSRSRILDCGSISEPQGEGLFRGGPAGVAFAHARILARVGSCSSLEDEVDVSFAGEAGEAACEGGDVPGDGACRPVTAESGICLPPAPGEMRRGNSTRSGVVREVWEVCTYEPNEGLVSSANDHCRS